MKRILFFLFLSLALIGFTKPAYAFEMRQGNDITVSKDTTITGSLVAGGKTVTIEGTINGDLYCGTQSLIVIGTVNGDVICGAQTVFVSGTIAGSLRTASQLLDITGRINRNVTSVGQTISINAPAIIAGELISAGQTININNAIGGDVAVAGQTLALGEKARVAGNLTYTSPAVLSEATGAAISGKVSHLLPPKESKQIMSRRNWIPGSKPWPANAIGGIVFYLIVGIIVVLVAKENIVRVTKQMLARPWFDLLMGFLTTVTVPITIIIMGITIIGIPIAVLLVFAYIFVVMLARIYVSLIVGEKIATALGRRQSGLVIHVIIGVAVVELFVKLPVIGIILSVISTFWGLGGFVMSFGKRKTAK